jgi:hypothetical protein
MARTVETPKKQNGIVKAVKRAAASAKAGININKSALYDFSTPETREATAKFLYEYAKMERKKWSDKWTRYDNYYSGSHDTAIKIQAACKSAGISFIPACVQDPFMHVESQIIPDIPDFEFYAHDDDLDSDRAKQREFVVQFILDNNKIENMNTRNERRLNKLGDAFWKVYWNNNISVPYSKTPGDIVIVDVDPANIFPDPAAYNLDDAEYVFHVYRLHKRKAARVYENELKALDMTIDDFGLNGNYSDTMIYNSRTQSTRDDTVQIFEMWYRDNIGEIACSTLINYKEVRFAPKYWENTGVQNKLFPFVKYCKIRDENNFWDTSELENIIDLVDAADREMSYGLLNSAYTSNDVTIVEDGALADGQEIDNRPGAIWHVKQGRSASVRRLGGMTSMQNREQTIEFFQSQIQQTIGNFDTTMGAEPDRVTTASGIAQLNERADMRKSIKKADRLAGFERLYELIDWTALEFYDDDRMIFLNVPDDGLRQSYIQQFNQKQQQLQQQSQQSGQPPQQPAPLPADLQKPIVFKFKYNSGNMKIKHKVPNPDNPDIKDIEYYYPRVSAKVWASDGLEKSKAFTILMTQQLINMPITIENYKIVESFIDLLNLPNRKDIKEYIEGFFKSYPVGIPKVTMAYKDLPPDGKVQEAAKIGLNIQTPEPADAQNVPYALLQTGAPTSGINVPKINVISPQEQQGGQQVDPQIAQTLGDILDHANVHLTPNELQHLQQHPEILEEMLKGGQQNG